MIADIEIRAAHPNMIILIPVKGKSAFFIVGGGGSRSSRMPSEAKPYFLDKKPKVQSDG